MKPQYKKNTRTKFCGNDSLKFQQITTKKNAWMISLTSCETPVEAKHKTEKITDTPDVQNTTEVQNETAQKHEATKTSSAQASDTKSFEAYSMLSENYIVGADGNFWYYEKYNDAGEIIFKKYYEKNILIKQQDFFYEHDLLVKMTEKENKITTNYFYDKNKNIVKIEQSENGKNFIIKKTYNEKNLLTQTEYEKDGRQIVQKLFYTSDKKLLREENYEDGIIISKIEYRAEKKRVHIYQNGKEIKVFDDNN